MMELTERRLTRVTPQNFNFGLWISFWIKLSIFWIFWEFPRFFKWLFSFSIELNPFNGMFYKFFYEIQEFYLDFSCLKPPQWFYPKIFRIKFLVFSPFITHFSLSRLFFSLFSFPSRAKSLTLCLSSTQLLSQTVFFFLFSLVRAFHWPNTGQTRFPLAQHRQVGPTYRVFLPRVGCGPTDRALYPC